MNPIKQPPYWINLDPLVDVDSLLKLHLYLCRAVALSPKQLAYGGRIKPKPGESLDDPFRSIGNSMLMLESLPADHPARIDTEGMTPLQKQYYLALRTKARCEGEIIGLISRVKGTRLDNSNATSANKHRTKAYENFLQFFEWVDAQNIFTEYGRANVFITPPFQHLTPHRDSYDAKQRAPEFIWVRTTLDKDLSIFDSDFSGAAPSKVQGHVVWFNGGCPHRAEPSKYMTFSLRVDGFFTPEFRQKIHAMKGVFSR